MKKVTPFDLERMLFGEAPPSFLIEVFFRGLLLYLFMLFIMRLLGKRMAGELTVIEMVLMITLGGSVAVAIQVPEGGALIGFVVLTCAILFERGISWLTTKSGRFETLSQGHGVILVKDGVLQVDKLKDVRVTSQQIFATLRIKQIHQLGEVERLYLEAGGTFSIYKKAGKAPAGLPLFPKDDKGILRSYQRSGTLKACVNCGYTAEHTDENCCVQCKNAEWVEAIS